ncbi:Transcriptional regulator, AbiEi antitoxin, Type IV TA system [Arthrobacter alpinus]|uniref:Transcriptional regulator, AbiEi antitoxin, Type IV TA system n=1 Tax=Arthrobacter alpinus TaxID=656366 RepID=A0A1H5NG97_9MICC|nr:type IV toxin-antitoxin system AbiEi family antitoxin domain-containing protein [Arthrobacter alpinus]SEF00623.1 Transcriptional regulator, AbiEi antitoxin, Type IV TA system [Arthrobacter alpinus]
MDTLRLIQPADLGRLGQDTTKLAKLCTKGELVRIRRGVYATSEEWKQLGPLQRYGAQAAAFQAVVATQPVLCHATAALLWGLWIVGVPNKLHVVTEVVGSGRSSKDVVRHVGSRMDNTVGCGPFLLTDKLRTTMVLIGELAFPYAVAVCDSALREPHPQHAVNRFGPAGVEAGRHEPSWVTDGPQGPALSLDELRMAASLLPSKAARERTLAVINFASALSGSAGESISRAKMHQLGFPAPILQKKYTLRDGKTALVDFWFKEQNVAGEFDGKAKYLRADWGGGSMEERLWKEKCREDDIRGQGVSFVRWTWRELQDRALFTALLRRAGLPQA